MNESRRNETPPPIPVAIPVVPVAEPVVVPPQVQPMQVPPQVQVALEAEPKPYEAAERKKIPVHVKVAAGLAFTTASVAAAAAAMLGMNRDKPNTPGIDTPNENGAAVLNLTTEEITEMTGTDDPEIANGVLDPSRLLDLDYLRDHNIGADVDYDELMEDYPGIDSEIAARYKWERERGYGTLNGETQQQYIENTNDDLLEMIWDDWKENGDALYNIGRLATTVNGEEGYMYFGYSDHAFTQNALRGTDLATELGFVSNSDPEMVDETRKIIASFSVVFLIPDDDADSLASR